MVTRIAILNNEVFRITEAKYNKIMKFGRYDKKSKKIPVYNEEQNKKEHQANCDLIRKYGKKILDADVMLRDD
jgi:hypothetical protein